MLKLVLRLKMEPVTAFGGLLLGTTEDAERDMERGMGEGNEDDRFGLGLGDPWDNPQE